ncbi:MAG: acyl carrier protein [Bacteroidales bacterium]|nr:acyl carrier protein [Bacteroidales bacterium]
MTRQEIIDTINEFLVEEIEIEEENIAEDAKLKDDLGIDSLDFVDIAVIVERKFGIKIKAEEMTSVRTLGDFYNYVDSRLNG